MNPFRDVTGPLGNVDAYMARYRRAQRLRFLSSFLLGAIATGLLAVIVLASGCAHKPPERVIRLPEPIGSPAAEALARAVGMKRINAVSLPGLPPVLFREDVDGCTTAHELRHKEQEREAGGPVMWAAMYLHNVAVCLEPVDPDERREALGACYDANPFEADAKRVEAECRGR